MAPNKRTRAAARAANAAGAAASAVPVAATDAATSAAPAAASVAAPAAPALAGDLGPFSASPILCALLFHVLLTVPRDLSSDELLFLDLACFFKEDADGRALLAAALRTGALAPSPLPVRFSSCPGLTAGHVAAAVHDIEADDGVTPRVVVKRPRRNGI